MNDNINSSEELQRHNASVFATAEAEKTQKADLSERDRIKKLLDSYIGQHSKTTTVREEAQKASRTTDYQLDLSADIVLILEKIKNELR